MFVTARKTILGLVLLAGLLVAAVPAHAAHSCVTGATTTTCTFTYAGAREAWVVPAGVTSAVFDVYGAQGGHFSGFGGKGGNVQATVALTPGETLWMRVAGAGGNGFGQVFGPGVTLTAEGGLWGGGTNWVKCPYSECFAVLGGAGGGASEVRTKGDTLKDRLLVAGGGGGAGLGSTTSVDPGNGGDSATAADSVTDALGNTCTGGQPGTLTAPGASGSGPTCSPLFPGDGPNGGGVNSNDTPVGAGGGGYFGGGTGTAGGHIPNNPLDYSIFTGGGGGSDYVKSSVLVNPSPTNPTITDGVQSGDGLITVTYANLGSPPTANAGVRSLSANASGHGVLVRWRTGTEANLLGFHVYRSRGHSWHRLTRSLITAKGSVAGGSYSFLDKAANRGLPYRYRIKVVNQDGTTTWFGPVRVTQQAPSMR